MFRVLCLGFRTFAPAAPVISSEPTIWVGRTGELEALWMPGEGVKMVGPSWCRISGRWFRV